MNINEIRQRVRNIISERVYSLLNEETDSMNNDFYQEMYDDFMRGVKRQKGIKDDSMMPLDDKDEWAVVFGDKYNFYFDFEIISKQYVVGKIGDGYFTPYVDDLIGDFEFNITKAEAVDNETEEAYDFFKMASAFGLSEDEVKDMFVFDSSAMIDFEPPAKMDED